MIYDVFEYDFDYFESTDIYSRSCPVTVLSVDM